MRCSDGREHLRRHRFGNLIVAAVLTSSAHQQTTPFLHHPFLQALPVQPLLDPQPPLKSWVSPFFCFNREHSILLQSTARSNHVLIMTKASSLSRAYHAVNLLKITCCSCRNLCICRWEARLVEPATASMHLESSSHRTSHSLNPTALAVPSSLAIPLHFWNFLLGAILK